MSVEWIYLLGFFGAVFLTGTSCDNTRPQAKDYLTAIFVGIAWPIVAIIAILMAIVKIPFDCGRFVKEKYGK